jgi:hypothetical protein
MLLLVHAFATLFMTGLIWFVQVVHYPLMAMVGEANYAAFQAAHQRRTTLVVGPAMLVEATSAALLLVPGFAGVSPSLSWAGAGLLAVAWVSTFAVQVPLHAKLERGFDAAVHRRLVATNWVRTAAWSLRAGVALAMIWAAFARA